ncbi:MAG TPA: MnhB domain-containing protein [Patescibacteria group bacterium]|nr:MnhB domain-containing protein [Patescibacteria group bacterium]
MKETAGMSIIVKRITKITVSLIFLFGVYILLHGHLTPGGGFAGGVIIALSFIHLVLAFGKDVALTRMNLAVASVIESLGGLLFWGIALLGFLGGYFFLNVLPHGRPFDLFSSGIILVCNVAIFLKVGAGLFSIFLALALLRMPVDDKETHR